MMEYSQACKNVINRMSDDLSKKWHDIKWVLPESVGKKDVILEGIETHAQLQLIYRIIHEIETEKNK